MILGRGTPGEVTWSDIQGLVGNATEGDSFEAKREPPGTSNADVKEYCRDACAMLNRGGGYLVYGLEEDEETRQIVAVTDFPLERIPERLEQIITSCLEPTPSFSIMTVPNPDNSANGCIIIWFPQNANEPFMVTKESENRYWARSNLTKHIMSEREVSEAYQRRSRMYDRLESYLAEKSYGLIHDEFFPNEHWCSVLILPVPFDNQLFSVDDHAIEDFLTPNNHPSRTSYNMGSILPGSPSIRQRRFEFRSPEDATPQTDAFCLTQVFDNGCIIHARRIRHDSDHPFEEIYGQFFCSVVYDGLTLAASLYERFVNSGHVVICANLPKTTGTHLCYSFIRRGSEHTIDYQIDTIRRDVPLLEFLRSLGEAAKSISDEFYNAYGVREAPCIRGDGSWNGDADF